MVYTHMKIGAKMKQQYVAPSLEILGSLSDLTLNEKEIGPTFDGTYLRLHGKKETLQNVS